MANKERMVEGKKHVRDMERHELMDGLRYFVSVPRYPSLYKYSTEFLKALLSFLMVGGDEKEMFPDVKIEMNVVSISRQEKKQMPTFIMLVKNKPRWFMRPFVRMEDVIVKLG